MQKHSATPNNPNTSLKSSMYSSTLNRSLQSGAGVSGIFVPAIDPSAAADQDYDAQNKANKEMMLEVFGKIHRAIPDFYPHRDVSGIAPTAEEKKDIDGGFLLGMNKKGTIQVEGYYGGNGEMIVKAATPEEFGKVADVLGESGYKHYAKVAPVAESKPAPAPKP